MSDKKLFFFEMRDKEIERLTILLDKLIKDQQIEYKLLSSQTDRNSFIFANVLSFINPRNEEIQNIHNIICKLKEFNNIKWIGSKRKKLSNGKFGDAVRTDFDLKTDGAWTKKEKCSKEQLEDISNAFHRRDKNLFYNTLLEITKNQSLTDRYTKYFFKSSIKHKSKPPKS